MKGHIRILMQSLVGQTVQDCSLRIETKKFKNRNICNVIYKTLGMVWFTSKIK